MVINWTHFQISGGLDLLITAFQTVICSLFCNAINLMLYLMIQLFIGYGLYPLGIDGKFSVSLQD